jgi:hypothetical protein
MEVIVSCHVLERDWLSYLTGIGFPLATVLVAGIVAGITYQQWKINREKIRLDLYNRRFDVYASFLNLYNALTENRHTTFTDEFAPIYRDFIKAQRESQFLFDPESGVYKILENVQAQSLAIILFEEKIESGEITKGTEQYDRMEQQAHNAKMVLLITFRETLEKAIAPYLNFHKI